MTEELLKQGIAAAKKDNREEAFRLLMQVTQIDPNNERAWLWLSEVVDSLDDKVICLENVLAINPDNRNARAGLAWLAEQGLTATATESPAEPPLEFEPEPVAPLPPPPVPDSAPEPDYAPLPASDSEPCPRCGRPVPLAQNDCAHCGLPMVIICPRCHSHVEVAEPSCPNCGLAIGDFRTGAGYHLALAEAYASHGKSDLIPSALAHARNEARRDPEVLVHVAEMYVNLGHLESAAEILDDADALAKRDAGLQARLGQLYQHVGRDDQAREAYELAAKLGGQPVALLEFARMELAQGHASRARELLVRVTKQAPTNAEAYLLLGDAERQMGKQAEAARRYEHASGLTSRETAVGREIYSRLVELEGQAAAEGRMDQQAGDADESERPGCVSVYVLMMALPALVGLFVALFVLLTGFRALDDPALMSTIPFDLTQVRDILPLAIALIAVTGLLQLLIAAGLWSMRNWARVILIALQLIVFAGQAVATSWTLRSMNPGAFQPPLTPATISILASFVALGLEAYIIIWFVTNRRRFV